MKKQTKTEMKYTSLINNLSQEDIFNARSNRDWSTYDLLNEKEKKELFITECLVAYGNMEFEDLPTYKYISKEGIVLFGKHKNEHITKVNNNTKLWYINNVDGFEAEILRIADGAE